MYMTSVVVMLAVRDKVKVWVSPVVSTKLLLDVNEAVVVTRFSAAADVT